MTGLKERVVPLDAAQGVVVDHDAADAAIGRKGPRLRGDALGRQDAADAHLGADQ